MQNKKSGVIKLVTPEVDGLYPAELTVSSDDKPQNYSGYQNANIVNHTSEREH